MNQPGQRVGGLDHINITAPKVVIDAVRQFYMDVLGLKDGFRPDFGVGGLLAICRRASHHSPY